MKNLPIQTTSLAAAFCALALAGCTGYSKVKKKSSAAVANTAEQRSILTASKKLSKEPLAQIGLYLDAANAARLKLSASPSNQQALSDYNFAVGRIMEIIGERDLKPWERGLACRSARGGNWVLKLNRRGPHSEFDPADFKIVPTDRYDFKGELVGERRLKPGLGAPVMISSKSQDYTKVDRSHRGRTSTTA